MTSTRCKPKGTPPLCACGCGQPTHWQASHNHWSARLPGHQNIGVPSKLRLDKGEPPLCACGCGQSVHTYRYPSGWVRYLNNHAPRQPHTPEAIEKMRQAALARSAQVAEQNRIRIWTPESREKARHAKLAVAREIAERVSGENNPSWRGGIAPHYRVRMQPDMTRYQLDKLHDQIRERDGHRCAICGMIYKRRKLDVHHVDGNLANNDPRNLITLCHKHHMQAELSKCKDEIFASIADYVSRIA